MGKVQFSVAFSISCIQWQSQHHTQFLFGRKQKGGGGVTYDWQFSIWFNEIHLKKKKIISLFSFSSFLLLQKKCKMIWFCIAVNLYCVESIQKIECQIQFWCYFSTIVLMKLVRLVYSKTSIVLIYLLLACA